MIESSTAFKAPPMASLAIVVDSMQRDLKNEEAKLALVPVVPTEEVIKKGKKS